MADFMHQVVRHLQRTFSFDDDVFDPTARFETSWLVSPMVLFAIRATWAFYSVFVIIFRLSWMGTHSQYGGDTAVQQSFSYFTWLTYWGLCLYYVVAAAHTFCYARWGQAPLDRFPRFLQALHQLYYSTIVTFPFIVTAIFWGLLYTGPFYTDPFEGWGNISQHGLNSLMALFELVLPRTAPPPWVNMFWLVVMAALYCGLAYLTYATEGFYVYSFLDPAENGEASVVAYVFGVGIAVCLVFSLAKLFIWLRVRFTDDRTCLSSNYIDRKAISQPYVEMETRMV